MTGSYLGPLLTPVKLTLYGFLFYHLGLGGPLRLIGLHFNSHLTAGLEVTSIAPILVVNISASAY